MLPFTGWLAEGDTESPVAQHGPYLVRALPDDWGYFVAYFQEEEPPTPEGLALAWAQLEMGVPGIADTSLVGMMQHQKDGRTLVVELYAR